MILLNARTATLAATILLSAGCNRQPSFTPAPMSSSPVSPAVTEPARPREVDSATPAAPHVHPRESARHSYPEDRLDRNQVEPAKGRSKLRSAEIIGGTAAAGAAIGALAGGGKAAAIGAIAGGGAGLLYDRATVHKNGAK